MLIKRHKLMRVEKNNKPQKFNPTFTDFITLFNRKYAIRGVESHVLTL